MSQVATPVLDEEAESLCRWAAARAGAIVLIPGIGGLTLCVNEFYMVNRIGSIYGAELSSSAIKGFLLAFAGMIAGRTLASLIPFPPAQLAIGIGTTYGLGRAATAWIKDGMPDDVTRYKELFEQAKAHAKNNLDSFKNDPRAQQPLGDENRKV